MISTIKGGNISAINVYADVDNLNYTKSPMTNDAIYARVGYKNKDTLVQAMIKDPSKNWAYAILLAAGNGFSFNFNFSLPVG